MWSQTSLSARKDICFRESSASCGRDSMRMAYRCPHLPQTTVSIGVSLGTASAVPRIRLATLGLTNGVHDADAVRDHCRHLGRFHDPAIEHRSPATRYGEPAVSLHSP